MDLQFFTANLYNPAVIIPAIRKEWKSYFEWKAFQQYDPRFHEILKKYKRKDKIISVPDPSGAVQTTGPNVGKAVMIQKTVYVSRIPLALQRLIVSRGTAFLTGGKVELKAKPSNTKEEQLYSTVTETWRKNKLEYKNGAIAEAFMSETECAEIWYSKKNNDGSISMKVKLFSPSKGFELVPTFDEMGDLIAFGLGYESQVENKKIRHMDVYTDSELIKNIDIGAGWVVNEKIALAYGKIPVIYYNLERAVWDDVQWMIDRLEYLVSNFADTNDYNGSPILFAKGNISGWSDKGESGKVIEGIDQDEGRKADLKYISWDHAPESIKMEKDMLLDFIFTITQTPNISFSEMKGLGDISGAAFDRMMIDGHLKARKFQNGMYGECIQRRLNFLCYACAETTPGLESAKDMEISAKFNLFSIDDVKERIANAQAANGGLPVISHEESIKMAGITDDPEGTYKAIKAQEEPAGENITVTEEA